MKNQKSIKYLITFALSIACALTLIQAASAGSPAGSSAPAADAPTPQIVAYYFHGDMRCSTCRKIEAYSDEAINQGFAKELASNQMEWKVVNTDQAENKHFVKDFALVTKSVVLVEYKDDKVVRFENLGKIWQLVGDKDDFTKYVQDETKKFIGQS